MAESESGGARTADPQDPGTLLFLARPGDTVAETFCGDHLAPDDSGAASLVVLTDRPSAELPPAGAVVVVGDGTRSTASSAGPPAELPAPGASPGTVVATEGLGSAGRTVDGYLTTWSEAGHRPVVCVDSVTGLVEGTSIRATYRFLYVLLHRVETLGGVAHAHADSRGHEEEIRRTFATLFDRVVSVRTGDAPRA